MAVNTIADGVVVSLAYTLTVDGQVIAQTEDGEPMEYLHGAENIVPGLEAALAGKKMGDKFSVTLAPEDAYGEYDEDDIEEIDSAELPAEDLEIGMPLEVEDEEGYLYLAFVREINPDTVVLDFNAPLAGKTLTYDVEVIGLREADEEELAHGHVHGYNDYYEYMDEDED